MARIVLVHWNEAEAEKRAPQVGGNGHQVEVFSASAGEGLRRFREDPPAAFVIDLSRLPSHGREVATFLRQQKATREVPLVFVAGAQEKIAKIREVLPDATYTSWSNLKRALSRVLKSAPSAKKPPIVPSMMAGYAGTPLIKKLGIKPESRVVLLGAPDEFEALLGEDGASVNIKRSARGQGDVIMFFVKSQADLQKRFATARGCMAAGARMWIAWPKKASGVKTDISEPLVRQSGLDAGLVDFKICAIDAIWSGLCFAVRKAN